MAEKDGIALLADYLQILKNSVSVGSEVQKLFGSLNWFGSHKNVGDADQVKIKEAETAKALGYLLCHCRFPPPIMTVKHVDQKGVELWECPCCCRESVTTASSLKLGSHGAH
jgi:hypothetical protein